MSENKKRSKKTHSQKKVKIHGTQTYVNTSTGEAVEMEVIEMAEKDINFTKVWLAHVLEALDQIGNKKIKILNWLMENMNNENIIIASQDMIAEKTGASRPIVNQTIKMLKNAGFLKQVQQGVLQINPECIFKGYHNKRMNVLLQYHRLDQDKAEKPTDELPEEVSKKLEEQKKKNEEKQKALQARKEKGIVPISTRKQIKQQAKKEAEEKEKDAKNKESNGTPNAV